MISSPGRSLWADTMPPDEVATGAPLPGDVECDVAIVGAGLTGLWTALYLRRADPSLRVVVLERDTIGFGASGRNGGWCSADFPIGPETLARSTSDAGATAMQRAMFETVSTVVDFAHEHGDGIAHRGGELALARTRPQLARMHGDVDSARRFGWSDDDLVVLGADEAGRRCAATGVLGGVWTPHCAAVHPLRLAHAVARAAITSGAVVHESTEVRDIGERRVDTDRGTVRADVVVRATEGFTSRLPGLKRRLLPIYSLMIATAPLGDEVWNQIGLADRPTFADMRRMVIYGQRTADGRLAFGGRGAPYHYGSAVRPELDTDDRIRQLLVATLVELFPVLSQVDVTHHWGGPLGAHRDWHPTVRYDPATGFATAGGYVGDGVSTTNLAGRTLTELITGVRPVDSDVDPTDLPWVGHRSRDWEPEPLRWLGVNLARRAAARADEVERRTDRSSRWWGGVVGRFLDW